MLAHESFIPAPDQDLRWMPYPRNTRLLRSSSEPGPRSCPASAATPSTSDACHEAHEQARRSSLLARRARLGRGTAACFPRGPSVLDPPRRSTRELQELAGVLHGGEELVALEHDPRDNLRHARKRTGVPRRGVRGRGDCSPLQRVAPTWRRRLPPPPPHLPRINRSGTSHKTSDQGHDPPPALDEGETRRSVVGSGPLRDREGAHRGPRPARPLSPEGPSASGLLLFEAPGEGSNPRQPSPQSGEKLDGSSGPHATHDASDRPTRGNPRSTARRVRVGMPCPRSFPSRPSAPSSIGPGRPGGAPWLCRWRFPWHFRLSRRLPCAPGAAVWGNHHRQQQQLVHGLGRVSAPLFPTPSAFVLRVSRDDSTQFLHRTCIRGWRTTIPLGPL